MSKIVKNILLGLLAVFVILQFFQIDKTNPEAPAEQDLMALTNPPDEVATLLKSACYDCHSNETVYPWYTNIQPVGWWTKDHVEEARGHLNFSEWGTYPAKKAAHKMEESYEEVEGGEMPLKSYTLAHSEARLNDEQRDRLVAWFQAQETQIKQAGSRSETPAPNMIRESGEDEDHEDHEDQDH